MSGSINRKRWPRKLSNICRTGTRFLTSCFESSDISLGCKWPGHASIWRLVPDSQAFNTTPMKISSFSKAARVTFGTLFLISGIVLLAITTILGNNLATNSAPSAARNAAPGRPLPDAVPPSGTLNPIGPTVPWAGTGIAGGATDESSCVEGVSCDTFTLTLSGNPADWVALNKKARVTISCPNGNVIDYDLYVHKGPLSGPLVPNGTSAHSGTPPEVVDLNPSDPNVGTGMFSVHVVYFSATAANQYSGTAAAIDAGTTSDLIPPAPPDTGPKIGFENFEAPGTLINVTSSSQGPSAATVEYLAHDAGEPSIGVNWQSAQDTLKGITVYQSDLQTLFVKFDDSCPSTGRNAIWYNSQAPSSQFVDSDPIGFVDRDTGRAFAAQLTLTSPECKISYTDTDGKDPLGNPGPQGWFAPSTGPVGGGIDHETLGGGPYHSPLIPPPPPAYQHAVYYASQDLVAAFCLRSDSGGATFNTPPIPMYTSECGGLHGHVKVAPDGTVYVPNNDCGGPGAVVVSEDNGLTWSIHPVQNASTTTTHSTNLQDPAVAIDSAGKAYFVMASSDSVAAVATSTDHGQTWQNIYDVGAPYLLKNIAFPAAIAGDSGRAAVAFYGSTTPGDGSANTFNGIWHLYVANTFDGGQTWTTTDVTPNDPVQRGCIWMHGGADICRNLLDFFDMTMDKQGRVQVGFVDGCTGGHCVQAASTAAGNGYAATAVITRQSSGRRLIASFDPPPTSVPGMPLVTVRRVGVSTRLSWSEADTGNSPLTEYRILRGTASGGENLLATVPPTQTTYLDSTATDTTQTYYYKVLAVNAVGMSCGNNEVAAPYLGNTCTGLIVQKTPPNHPEQQLQGNAPASLAIDYIAVAEPPTTNNIAFKMKVTSLAGGPPVSSRWRIDWNSYAATSYPPGDGQQFYVGMRTDANGVVTFEYGTVATAVVGLVIGVPTETMRGPALPESNFAADGTITIVIPKSVVGNPQPGDLLGAVNGRTFTGDTPDTQNLQRSTLLVDHTFVKGQRDNGYPAATYTVVGNTPCPSGVPVPVGAVSRKTHGSAGTWDVDLPLTGTPGIECRLGQGPSSNQHRMVITFVSPVTVNGNPQAAVTSGTGQVDAVTVNGSVVTVDLSGVTNAQTITLTLFSVSDGTNTGDVAIRMSVLAGDTNANATVNSSDISQTKSQTGNSVGGSNFREDVTVNGEINSSDISVVKAHTGTGLP